MKTEFLKKCYPFLDQQLIKEIEACAVLQSFGADEYVVKQGQYIRYLPVIYSGCIKVFCREDTIDFLLYYISSGESCIYSFAHVHDTKPAAFSAVAELDSELLLLPIDKVSQWVRRYPSLNQIIINNYSRHYHDLLESTKQMICYNLEERLLEYLKTKSELYESHSLSLSHQHIATELGSSREVISRLMKKLSLQGKVKQEGRKIRML